MKSNLNRQETEEYIKQVFSKKSSQKEIKSAKKLAMGRNIKLGNLRKKFCKKCYTLFNSENSEIRVKKGFKIIKCKNCRNTHRYKLR